MAFISIMNRTMLGSLFLPFAIAAATLAALNGGARTTPPAYACSGAYPDLDDAVRLSDAIAIVDTTAVGGAVNLAPTQTPVTITPIAGFPTPNPMRTKFDLTGVGAVVRRVETINGTLPSDVRLDDRRRNYIEGELRRLEANPYTISPCALGFLLQRYEPNQRYLVFLDRGDDGGWNTNLRFRIAGDYVITGGLNSEDDPSLRMTSAVRDRFFPGIPAEGPFEVEEWGLSFWVLTSTNVPFQALIDATRALLAGEIPGRMTPTPTPEHEGTVPSPTPSPGVTIGPPSVGDGGLR
jgi:hypothetical protein